jgi:NitT/TauT family transport system permease protein
MMSKILIAFLVSFFPLVVNTITGLRAVETDLVDLMRSLGAPRPS